MNSQNKRLHRSGCEMRVWSIFADLLDSLSMASFYELLGLGEGACMKALDLAGADCAYQHYVDNCQRLGTRPMPWNRALAKWIETF